MISQHYRQSNRHQLKMQTSDRGLNHKFVSRVRDAGEETACGLMNPWRFLTCAPKHVESTAREERDRVTRLLRDVAGQPINQFSDTLKANQPARVSRKSQKLKPMSWRQRNTQNQFPESPCALLNRRMHFTARGQRPVIATGVKNFPAASKRLRLPSSLETDARDGIAICPTRHLHLQACKRYPIHQI